MKFKTLNEVFAIPAEYQVKDYKVIYSYKHGKVDSPGLIKDISSLFRYTETGDWVTFTGITITNGDKEIKLDDKCYVIK